MADIREIARRALLAATLTATAGGVGAQATAAETNSDRPATNGDYSEQLNPGEFREDFANGGFLEIVNGTGVVNGLSVTDSQRNHVSIIETHDFDGMPIFSGNLSKLVTNRRAETTVMRKSIFQREPLQRLRERVRQLRSQGIGVSVFHAGHNAVTNR